MGKLGVQTNTTSTYDDSDTNSLRIAAKNRPGRIGDGTETEDSRSLAGTIDMNTNANEKIQLDQASPKEVKRTTVIFNENAANPKYNSRHS